MAGNTKHHAPLGLRLLVCVEEIESFGHKPRQDAVQAPPRGAVPKSATHRFRGNACAFDLVIQVHVPATPR